MTLPLPHHADARFTGFTTMRVLASSESGRSKAATLPPILNTGDDVGNNSPWMLWSSRRLVGVTLHTPSQEWKSAVTVTIHCPHDGALHPRVRRIIFFSSGETGIELKRLFRVSHDASTNAIVYGDFLSEVAHNIVQPASQPRPEFNGMGERHYAPEHTPRRLERL
ncbi:hypothetical protein [Acidisphaera sp. L21]|uniref:hypothetical protein n=1 Tax=Acidisphaera sp. L21 TaxID=1641851 RepID=UPI00131DD420|nr:hypothetical protein [Acidisphaera sp. L21]